MAEVVDSAPHAIADVPVAAPVGGRRMAWLDVLRGLAALAVVYHHTGYWVWTKEHDAGDRWFAAGVFGTALFFLISGYIIPASLERRGSLRGFWISRIFRLYPLWVVVIVAVVLLDRTGHYWTQPSDTYLHQHHGAFALAHATMFQDLLDVPAAIGPMWSLSYEMVFYCLISGLFVLRAHRSSPGLALLIAALGAIAVPTLPYTGLSHRLGTAGVTAAVAALFVVGLAATMSGVRRPATCGALGLAVVAAVLLYADRGYPWDGLLIPSYMFVGTTVYRAQAGQIRVRTAVLVAGAVFALVAMSNWFHADRLHTTADGMLVERRHWIGAVLIAGTVFGVGLLLRHRRMPRLLSRLGEISYSVYLLHLLLLALVTRQLSHFGDRLSHDRTPGWEQAAALAATLVAVCLCAEVTFRLVEQPAQRLGQRVARRVDARFGSDAGLFGPSVSAGSRRRRPRAVHS